MQNQTHCKHREKIIILSPFCSLFFLSLRWLPFMSQGIIHAEIDLVFKVRINDSCSRRKYKLTLVQRTSRTLPGVPRAFPSTAYVSHQIIHRRVRCVWAMHRYSCELTINPRICFHLRVKVTHFFPITYNVIKQIYY